MNKKSFIGVAAVLSALAGVASNVLGASAFPSAATNTISATMDGGVAKTGNTWYELGVNTAAPTTGIKTGLVTGQTDPLSTYLIQPAHGNNALMLDATHKTGSLIFSKPFSFSALSLAGSSGNGTGTNVMTLHFSDGTSDTLAPLNAGDWFGNEPRTETAHGRIDVAGNVFNNVNDDNPRILALNETLSAADAAKFITSIDISWTGGATTHTAIFGISGDLGTGHFTAVPLNSLTFNQDMIVGLSEVPEPGTLALLGLGALGLFACTRRNRQ